MLRFPDSLDIFVESHYWKRAGRLRFWVARKGPGGNLLYCLRWIISERAALSSSFENQIIWCQVYQNCICVKLCKYLASMRGYSFTFMNIEPCFYPKLSVLTVNANQGMLSNAPIKCFCWVVNSFVLVPIPMFQSFLGVWGPFRWCVFYYFLKHLADSISGIMFDSKEYVFKYFKGSYVQYACEAVSCNELRRHPNWCLFCLYVV